MATSQSYGIILVVQPHPTSSHFCIFGLYEITSLGLTETLPKGAQILSPRQ